MARSNGKVSLTDIVDADFLDKGFAALSSEFEAFQHADQRGKRQLWSMLGCVYELGTRTDANSAAKAHLIAMVNESPNCAQSNRWRAENKTSSELLITLLLGRDEKTKATRSHWLSAIKAAKQAGVEARQAEYAAWVELVGGMDAARQLASAGRKASPRHSLDELLAELVGGDAPYPEIDIPSQLSGEALPLGIGLVIVKQGKLGEKATPIAVVSARNLIERTARQAIRDRSEIQKANQKIWQEHERQRLKPLKVRYRQQVKAKLFEGDFESYLEAGAPQEI